MFNYFIMFSADTLVLLIKYLHCPLEW